MAYSIKPTYEPMTFQEMLQPYAVYGAEEERQNDAYMKLLEDARSLEDLKDSGVDSEEYNKYVDFKNRINSMVDEISATGLSRQTRDNLNKYRAEYQSNFANMVDRIKRRGELVKQQRAYLAEHPNAFFDVDYSNTPAIKVVEGSSYTPYDMDTAEKQAASDIYNLYLNKGKDTTTNDIAAVADSVRAAYNYDTLDDNKKAKVDSAITNGGMAAYKAFTDYAYKQQLNQAKLAKANADAYKSAYGRYQMTGERIGRSSGGSSGVVRGGTTGSTGYSGRFEKHIFPGVYGGVSVQMNPSKDAKGNNVYTYKGIDKKDHVISEADYKAMYVDDGRTTYTDAEKEFLRNIYGGIPVSEKNFGYDMTVFKNNDGNVVKVVDANGNIVDTNGSSRTDIYKAYKGIDKLPKVMTLSNDAYENLYSVSGDKYKKPFEYDGTKKEYINSKRNGEKIDQDVITNYEEYDDIMSRYDSSNVYAGTKKALNEFIKEITGVKDDNEVMEKLKEVFNLGYHIEVTFYGNTRNNKIKQFQINLYRDEDDAKRQNNNKQNESSQEDNQQQQTQQRAQRADSSSVSVNPASAESQIDTTAELNGNIVIE